VRKRRTTKSVQGDFEMARDDWQDQYHTQVPEESTLFNRSGIEMRPLYTASDWNDDRYMQDLGFPGQLPATRGIYASMHRGRSWSQRQLIGLGTPEDYNKRLRTLLEAGVNAVSLIPCNSVYRGYDVDMVDPALLGTCGTTVNSIEDMETCLRDIPIGEISTALNDPLPFTLLAFLLGVARRRGIPWTRVTGTSNQSDYISHFVANHMFLRLSLPGSRRLLLDQIAFCSENVPNWNPVSIVGQHMQQAGATPAEALALTFCTAIQFTQDCIDRGMDPNRFLSRFTFFFDISISFFEEIAKFRAGRRIWSRIVRERFGVNDPKAWRFKFHSQTSGVDLTRQQPLNNIGRVAIQALAGVFGGTQSMHTDAYDEALTTPTEAASRVAINTQNIIRDEAHLDKVIDPLAGSYYVETLTNEMETLVEEIIARIDTLGGMYQAVESGVVQTMIGESALAFQNRVENGEQKIVGVNAYCAPLEDHPKPAPSRCDPGVMAAQIDKHRQFKARRDQGAVGSALSAMTDACRDRQSNVFEQVVAAAEAGVTHGEICHCLRTELGFGQPLVVV